MQIFDIFIAYISWGSGGKNRPVLVFMLDNNNAEVFKITTKYENKSPNIQKLYYEIVDWKQAGLSSKSYIDTGTLISLPSSVFNNKSPAGTLSTNDILGLFKFLFNIS